MAVQSFMVGTRPAVTARFYAVDVAGVQTAADPTTIRVVTRSPGGTQVTYQHPDATITQIGVGVWQFRFPAEITETGMWRVYFDGDGSVDVADEVQFLMKPSRTLG